MRSSTPIVFGFLALVGLAFWYDAHSQEVVDAFDGAGRASAAAVAAAPRAADPSPAPAAIASQAASPDATQGPSLVAREEK